MAIRPVFLPKASGSLMVQKVSIEFQWFPGMSKNQKQRSIRSLHASARKKLAVEQILEISSKSEDQLGVELSAFNLRFNTPDHKPAPVEVLFQGGKVFERGGPFMDLYFATPREAKKDERLKISGNIVGFRYGPSDWPLNPQTLFIIGFTFGSHQKRNEIWQDRSWKYDAFTDIEFNPEKSLSCQAFSAALYKSLSVRGLVPEALSSKENFIRICYQSDRGSSPIQRKMF